MWLWWNVCCVIPFMVIRVECALVSHFFRAHYCWGLSYLLHHWLTCSKKYSQKGYRANWTFNIHRDYSVAVMKCVLFLIPFIAICVEGALVSHFLYRSYLLSHGPRWWLCNCIIYLHWLFLNYANHFIIWPWADQSDIVKSMSFQKEVFTLSNWLLLIGQLKVIW